MDRAERLRTDVSQFELAQTVAADSPANECRLTVVAKGSFFPILRDFAKIPATGGSGVAVRKTLTGMHLGDSAGDSSGGVLQPLWLHMGAEVPDGAQHHHR